MSFNKNDLNKIGEFLYEIPRSYRDDMNVPARIYADEDLLKLALRDKSIGQLVNTTALPGVVKHTLAMPDIHQGYGPPIGGVSAMRTSDGVISPGAVGYDINCGVRVLRSPLAAEEVMPLMKNIMDAIFREVPTGVGRSGDVKLNSRDMDKVLEQGVRWTVSHGYATKDDMMHTEEQGSMPGANAGAVSSRAKSRGQDQLGTLGSGNHFIEVGRVEEVYDEDAARKLGFFLGQLVVWIHSGSRGLGHQVCTDYVKGLQRAVSKYKIKLPDRELVCAPYDSPEGRDYFGAMACAANYAWSNRQLMTWRVRNAMEKALAGKVKDWELQLVYDVTHNIAKVEEHEVDGKQVELVVHRKGATRAFAPGRPEVPQDYREIGQPVLVPGDMGTASYVLVGTQEAMDSTFGTSCHGAGRVMSRRAAKRKVYGKELKRELGERGIIIRARSMSGLAEEAPIAYKEVNNVVNVVHNAGIARKVIKTVPLGVVKG